ncbi:MAG: bacillithiol system redox-active protein YtxJ [Saprospiraceae bacterium]|nr:bacillithiol system redox-active protein YtxJ [Saprospiraceae bacterium]
MLKWLELTQNEQIAEIAALSHQKPCTIYKHSTRCALSSIAKRRLESGWFFEQEDLPIFYLDVIEHRALSKQVAEFFSVYHESPQLLLIRQGECTYEASHLEISLDEFKKNFY